MRRSHEIFNSLGEFENSSSCTLTNGVLVVERRNREAAMVVVAQRKDVAGTNATVDDAATKVRKRERTSCIMLVRVCWPEVCVVLWCCGVLRPNHVWAGRGWGGVLIPCNDITGSEGVAACACTAGSSFVGVVCSLPWPLHLEGVR